MEMLTRFVVMCAWEASDGFAPALRRWCGPGTAKLGERMSSFNPDRTWQTVSDMAPVQ